MAHNPQHQACIDACFDCASICNHCASGCLQEEDVKMLARCIQLDLQCSIVCNAAGQLMSLGGEHATHLCQECAEICDACDEECEKHAQHGMEHCRECAEACRRCAEECRKMAGVAA